MKTIDVTEPVMNRVVEFERRRSGRWMAVYIGFIAMVSVCVAALLLVITSTVTVFRSGDMFSLLYEDSEIIREFWGDTVSVLLDELPMGLIALSAGLTVVCVIVMVITRKKRQIVSRRRKELAKITKKRTIL